MLTGASIGTAYKDRLLGAIASAIIANVLGVLLPRASRHQRLMSTDAGTEEHRVSRTLLPMPRRIEQLPSLPVPDATTCSAKAEPVTG